MEVKRVSKDLSWMPPSPTAGRTVIVRVNWESEET